MEFYDSDGVKRTYQKRDSYFKVGGCAYIYVIDDLVLKEYNKFTSADLRIDYEIIKVLKNINSNNFIKIMDILFSEEKINEEELENMPFLSRKHIVDAYTYKFIPEKKLDISILPKDYFLNNVEGLEKLFDEFNELKMVLSDIKPYNTIINDENIVILDPDHYMFYDENDKTISWDFLAMRNKRLLLRLLRRLLIEDKTILQVRVDDLLSDDLLIEKDMTSAIAKKLKNHKRPIDYLRK